MPKEPSKDHVFADCLQDTVRDEDYFGPGGPCPILHEMGNPRLVLITGENAGGKSFFAKVLGAALRRDAGRKIEFLRSSMATRTEGGLHRLFMYGAEEDRESTGKISVHAVLGGLHTSRGRDNAHVLMLDEPDIGLGEGYQAALGKLIAEFAADMPEKLEALVVVTHSRALAAELMPLGPTCIRAGDDRRKTKDWIKEGDLKRTPDDIRGLAEKSHKRMKAIQSVINGRQRERQAEDEPAAGPKR